MDTHGRYVRCADKPGGTAPCLNADTLSAINLACLKSSCPPLPRSLGEPTTATACVGRLICLTGSYLLQAGVLGADAGRLTNHVIVAGGQCSASSRHVLNSAEVWDPKRDSWELLPPMRHARAGARGFVLPGGRFAVVGGMGLATGSDAIGSNGSNLEMRRDAEVYNVDSNSWTSMPDDCANGRSESHLCN